MCCLRYSLHHTYHLHSCIHVWSPHSQNHGINGIRTFMGNHRCNPFCKALHLSESTRRGTVLSPAATASFCRKLNIPQVTTAAPLPQTFSPQRLLLNDLQMASAAQC